jgi:glycosyltransferase involved in cell wall biosynthesis
MAHEVYDGFDVLLQPDSYAGFNRVLYEAQAYGLPVVTTTAPPMDECETPFLVPVDREMPLESEANPTLAAAGRCLNMTRYFVSAEAVAEIVRTIAQARIEDESRQARMAAERRTWTLQRAQDFVALIEAALC